MATVTAPIDGRPQYDKLTVEIVNALNGRDPRAGVVEQVGDRYIIDRFPPAARTDSYGGGSVMPSEAPKTEEPKSSAAAGSLWPGLR